MDLHNDDLNVGAGHETALRALERGLLRREADKRGLEGLLALARKNLIQSPACRDRLRALKVPDYVITSGLVGAMPAFFDGPHNALRWTPDECAAPCVVVGIRDDIATATDIDHPDPDQVTLRGTLIDIAAFRTDAPGTWSLYSGLAKIAGRADLQYVGQAPTLVSRHLLGWLQVAFRGITILGKSRDEIRDVVLQLPGGIETLRDPAYATELKKIAERPWPVPPIRAVWPSEKDM